MTHIFLQARTSSTRLPNKVLLPFYNDKNILDIIVEKLQKHFPLIPIIVCTTNNKRDSEIIKFCEKRNLNYFRGDEKNVLKRFIDAGHYYKCQNIIRICSDNPFLDINFLNELIAFHNENPEADYWSFKNGKNIPVIKTHFGFFCEIVTLKALEDVASITSESIYLEHVTNFIYEDKRFKCEFKTLPNFLKDRNDLRFTIDDIFDFEMLQKIYTYYKEFNEDIMKTIFFVEKNPSLLKHMITNINKYSK
ncbi:cytidylyltransferase domain-containing protein [Flavobacterium mesophilum]|uniref:cytidylyltransferase domain-containing protein n=1 Tax=Flavobacterium mesophilum TaxID=3143495 RepID=UPI0031E17FBD